MFSETTKICGIFDRDIKKEIKHSSLIEMSKLMNHAQSPNISIFANNICGIGQINSINYKNKLFWNKDKSICVIFSGYLLNFHDDVNLLIKKGYKFSNNFSINEYILNLYIEYNENFIKRLNGIFNIIIYDNFKDLLLIFNDRYGFRPLYFYKNNSSFIFASEIKSITYNKKVKREIDWKAWSDFMYLGSINGNNTFFKNILVLPPASILKYKNNKFSIINYWTYDDIIESHNLNEDYLVDKGSFLIKQAVKRCCNNLKRADCLLSGGYDSRCISMIIKFFTRTNLSLFTSLNEFGSREDEIIAKNIAKLLNFKHKFIPLPNNLYKSYYLKWFNILDGITDQHLWMMPLVEDLANYKYNFDGIAGDVTFGKNFIRQSEVDNFIKNKDYNLLVDNLLNKKGNLKDINSNLISKMFKDDIKTLINKNIISSILSELKFIKNKNNIITYYFLKNRTRRAISLAPNSILLTKRESYLPFLDNDLINFTLSIPHQYKNKINLYKKILFNINPSIMKIPSTYDQNKNIPPRVNIPAINSTNKNYINNLFNSYKVNRDLLNINNELAYPGSRYVHFHLWYNLFYKS